MKIDLEQMFNSLIAFPEEGFVKIGEHEILCMIEMRFNDASHLYTMLPAEIMVMAMRDSRFISVDFLVRDHAGKKFVKTYQLKDLEC